MLVTKIKVDKDKKIEGMTIQLDAIDIRFFGAFNDAVRLFLEIQTKAKEALKPKEEKDKS